MLSNKQHLGKIRNTVADFLCFEIYLGHYWIKIYIYIITIFLILSNFSSPASEDGDLQVKWIQCLSMVGCHAESSWVGNLGYTNYEVHFNKNIESKKIKDALQNIGSYKVQFLIVVFLFCLPT